MSSTILFLCTGNYYRSRFAEELFNFMAPKAYLHWTATSRGLAIELGTCNAGPISIHAKKALLARGVDLINPPRHSIGVTPQDLLTATRVIALKEVEHRPYLARRYPDWPDRVEYWNIHDLDQATPEIALGEITEKVTILIEQLKLEPSRTK